MKDLLDRVIIILFIDLIFNLIKKDTTRKIASKKKIADASQLGNIYLYYNQFKYILQLKKERYHYLSSKYYI